ncbi:hypothetical protein BBJ28_00024930, partial [Nothophytophthora sp. Chile5]
MEEERRPLLGTPPRPNRRPTPPLVGPIHYQSQQDEDDIDKSGTSIISGAGSDAMTYDAMMQLSKSRNPFRYEKIRSLAIWLVTSSILFLTNQLT